MARRCQNHHMIQVWILMMIRTWSMLRIMIRRSMERDMLLMLVRRYHLLLGAVDLILDTGWSWATNSMH